jgi:virulence-associated protein VagC
MITTGTILACQEKIEDCLQRHYCGILKSKSLAWANAHFRSFLSITPLLSPSRLDISLRRPFPPRRPSHCSQHEGGVFFQRSSCNCPYDVACSKDFSTFTLFSVKPASRPGQTNKPGPTQTFSVQLALLSLTVGALPVVLILSGSRPVLQPPTDSTLDHAFSQRRVKRTFTQSREIPKREDTNRYWEI